MFIKKAMALFTIIIILAGSIAAYAAPIPYKSYTYNQWSEPVESPAGYEPLRLVDGDMLGVGRLIEPADFHVTKDNRVYILDSGNNRIIVTDTEFSTSEIIDSFDLDGEKTSLSNAQSIYVDNKGYIFIADTDNKRIIKANKDGRILNTYVKPVSDLYPADADFVPFKIAVDNAGIVYAICKGVFNGAVMYSPEGEFLGFFGSNKVDITLRLLTHRMWKKILSDEQRSKLPNYIPVEYTSLEIDDEDFVYTCTLNSQNPANMLRKINPLGVNILEGKVGKSFQRGFGDLRPYYDNGVLITTRFIDICVSDKGHITALDFTRGRIFQYDQDANLIFAFGGLGNQMGMFRYPTAIDSIGDNLIVLDKSTGSLTEFGLTEFGKKVHKGIELYNDGRYIESIEPWNEVLKFSTNYNLAYIGIGKAMLELGEYENAMKYFKTGHYAVGYNSAYNEFRRISMRSNFKYIFILTILLLMYIFGSNLPPVKKLNLKVKGLLKSFTEITSQKLSRRGDIS